MKIHKHHQDGILVVSISGRLDTQGSTDLDNELRKVISEGEAHLVLDLGYATMDSNHVSYVSSSGLHVLSKALTAACNLGGDMCLASVPKGAMRVLRIIGFDKFFNIYDTVPEAVSALAASKGVDLD